MSHNRAAGVVALVACLAPLFGLTVKGWTNWVLGATALVSVVLLLSRRAGPAPVWARADRRSAWWLVAALSAPLVATLWSALLRGNLAPAQFDAPFRFVLAIPLFLVVARSRVDVHEVFKLLLPLGLAITLWQLEPHRWGALRPATSFTDPLTVGYTSLTFSLMCLTSICFRKGEADRPLEIALKLVGVGLGAYISMRSGSRSGWLAVPIVLAFWLHLNARLDRRWAWVAFPALAAFSAVVLYLLLPTVHMRIDLAINEVITYNWTGVAPISSIGDRITYLRIAADLLVQHPWAGVGDTSRMAPAAVAAFPYATRDTVETAFTSGLHNQVLSNTLRLGVAGFVATVLLLAVPIVVCARHLGDAQRVTRRCAAVGVAFGVAMLVSSLSTEIVDLKYMASLYAVMVAVLCGAVLAARAPFSAADASSVPIATRGQ